MKQSVDNKLAKNVWEKIGDWWDEQMAEGDIFHRVLVHPYVIAQLELCANDCVLDLACGNGALTRLIAKKVNKVVGVDFSTSLLNNARRRTQAERLMIDYHSCDLTDPTALAQLTQFGPFDKVTCSMALHDIENIVPLINIVKNLLPKGGYFVVSVPHPCFNSGNITLKVDEKIVSNEQGVLRKNYIKPVNFVVHAKQNQPLPHPHFHRPISTLLNEFFQKGYVLDRCDEPVMDNLIADEEIKNFLWSHLPEIPPVMILRFVVK